jgi:hypothetical protein
MNLLEKYIPILVYFKTLLLFFSCIFSTSLIGYWLFRAHCSYCKSSVDLRFSKNGRNHFFVLTLFLPLSSNLNYLCNVNVGNGMDRFCTVFLYSLNRSPAIGGHQSQTVCVPPMLCPPFASEPRSRTYKE